MSKEALKLALEAVDKAYDELARAIRDKTSYGDAYVELGMAHHYLKQAIALAKQEQGEPVACMRMPKVGDRVICIEDEDLGTVQSLTAGGSPDIKFDDGSYGTYLLREFSELFRYADTTPQQRTWVD